MIRFTRLGRALLRTASVFAVGALVFGVAIGGGKLMHRYGWPVAVAVGFLFFAFITALQYSAQGDE